MNLLTRHRRRPTDDTRSWDELLHDLILDHIANEQDAMQAYEQAIHAVEDEGVRHLLRSILDDERSHHQRLQELAASIETMVTGARQLRSMPPLHAWRTGDELLRVTAQLLEVERQDARDLDVLSEELHETRWSSPAWITVQQLRHDTEKHIITLEYLQELAQRNLSDHTT